jgi:hypothetical protein
VAGYVKPTISPTQNFVKAKNLVMNKFEIVEEKMVSYMQEESKTKKFQALKAQLQLQ